MVMYNPIVEKPLAVLMLRPKGGTSCFSGFKY